MAKQRKKGRSGTPSIRTIPRQVVDGLQRADMLMEQRRWSEAKTILTDLGEKYPRRVPILERLAEVAYELEDMAVYEHAVEQLVALRPNDPDLAIGLAGAYMMNARPALAWRAFREFLRRWPGDERAPDIRKTVQEMEEKLSEVAPPQGFDGPDVLETAAEHEEIQLLLTRNDWARARALAEDLLRRKPKLVPVLNNLSQVYFFEGNADQAIATARRALAVDPDNVHALSNLTRFLLLGGHIDEANDLMEWLKAVEIVSVDSAIKVAEALSFLGDDQGVLDVLHDAEAAAKRRGETMEALLYHLGAVAAYRQGRETEAKRLWRRALKLQPSLDLAQQNLKDLDRPVGERHAAWPYDLTYWVPRATIEALTQAVTSSTLRDDDADSRTREFLRHHPELARLVPLLLDRGDPSGRQFALLLATSSQEPEMLETLRDFGLSQRGPDDVRHQALAAASEAGLLPGRTIRMWLGGEWHEAAQMGFEITGEPVQQHSPAVEELQYQATIALRERNGDRAEELLKRALEIEPDAPSLLNNLASAYLLQGRHNESEALVRQIHERYPDYLFGRTNVAHQHIRRGELDAAEALLEPLNDRKRFHISEFSALAGAHIELLMAQEKWDAAASWLDMLRDIDPDNPQLPRLELLLTLSRPRPRQRRRK